jgi:triphosphatase
MNPSKPQETELKLSLPGQFDGAKVVRRLQECGYAFEEPNIIQNDDLYLDTYDWSLMKKKLSLRYRLENGRAMYTLKSIGEFDKGIAQRDELEIALDKPTDNPQEIAAKQIRNEVQPLIFPRKLVELLRVITLRKEYALQTPEGAKISLAIDRSSFSRERQPPIHYRRKVHELEAELKEGNPTALVNLRKLISDNFNYAVSKESKLQHAIELLRLSPLSRQVNRALTARLDDPVEIALQKIIASEFQWFQRQLPGVVEDYDPEFVHQARVTTRRMRSAIKVFSAAIPRSTGDYLANELKWLASLFGTVRDIDVYIINLSIYDQKLDFFPGSTRRELVTSIEKQRREPLKELLYSLASPRYRTFERRIKNFIHYPPEIPAEMKTISQFAPEVINHDFQAVLERAQDVLVNPEMKRFHLLRIEMKKLRYATEFVAPAYGDAFVPFIRRTTEIQDCLGELQDTVFTRDFSLRLIEDVKKSADAEVPFVLGEIYQCQAEIARERRERFSGIWSHFASPDTSGLLNQIFGLKNQTV